MAKARGWRAGEAPGLNLFNRLFAIVALLALLTLAIVVLLSPREAIDNLAAWLNYLEQSPLGTLARVVAALLVIAFALVGLYLELRRPPRNRVVVGRIEGAIAELSVDAIGQRLRRDTLALSGVRSVQPEIIPRRNGVDVRLRVVTDPDVDVPATAAEVARLAREGLEGKMGLRVGRLWVNINHEASGASPPGPR